MFNPFLKWGFSQQNFIFSGPKKNPRKRRTNPKLETCRMSLVSIEVADPDHASWSDVPSEVEGKNIAKTDGVGFSGSPHLEDHPT